MSVGPDGPVPGSGDAAADSAPHGWTQPAAEPQEWAQQAPAPGGGATPGGTQPGWTRPGTPAQGWTQPATAQGWPPPGTPAQGWTPPAGAQSWPPPGTPAQGWTQPATAQGWPPPAGQPQPQQQWPQAAAPQMWAPQAGVYPQPYPQPGYSAMTPGARTNGMAVASMVLGITSILFFWLGLAELAQIILAFVFASKAMNVVKMGAPGREMAMAGLICGGIGALFYLLFGAFTGGAGFLL